jgi:hypothetical protein
MNAIAKADDFELVTGADINAQNRGDIVHIEIWSDSEKEELEVSELRMGGWLIWNDSESPADGRISRSGAVIELPYSQAMRMNDLALVKTDDAVIVLEQDPTQIE